MRRKLVDKERLGYLLKIYILLCLLVKYAQHEQAVSIVSRSQVPLAKVHLSCCLCTAIHDITM